jgi:Type I restriction enzyme R protein N terminus (HSDR_N)
MPIALTEALTTAQAEQHLNLQRTEATTFFPEWHGGLLDLTPSEQNSLDELRRRYLYQRSVGHLLEGTVTLLFASPFLAIAGFYDPPFRIRAEESVQIRLEDSQETLQGRIDVLVLQEQLWIVVLESKKTMLSIWSALPQTLAYLMANPEPSRPSFGMMTNGDEIVFLKLQQSPIAPSEYDISRVFAPFTSNQELYSALQIVKGLGKGA